MDLGRRGFLSVLLAAAVAPDPERLLWTPGKKLISIPAPMVPAGFDDFEWYYLDSAVLQMATLTEAHILQWVQQHGLALRLRDTGQRR